MTRPIRVLHLEDSARDAEIIRHKLAVDGLSFTIRVANGRESFETALADEPFDLIISDYNLPGYDGAAALKRAQDVQPDAPVILVSGTVVEEQAIECLQMGATDYLIKDRLDRLVPAVQRALREADARRTRKQAEATLVRLAAIVDSSDDAIFSMGMDGTVLTWNGGAARLYGYTANEMIGRNRIILAPAEKSDDLIPLLARAARGEPGEPRVTQRRRKDGSLVDISLLISPIADPTGSITSVSTIARDITNLKQAEASLRDERDLAQQYLDTAEVILLKLDVEGRILLVNRYACALLGWTAEELLGRNWIDTCLPAEIRDEIRRRFLHPFEGERSVSESPVLTRAGEERLVEWRCQLLRDEEGRAVGLFSSGNDITDRNLAVEALRTAEERMRFALEAAGIGIWDVDCTTGAVRWSGILEAQFGLQPGTFGGTFESFTERLHPDDRESVVETIGRAMKAGGDFSLLHRTICPDGRVRWLAGTGRMLLGEHGEPVRGVGISQDVTERHALEQQYHQAQKMEAIGQLAGGVAHDFNNLLTVILGFCELLLADLDPADPRKPDIVEIQKAGVRAAGLTRQLLTFSRKEIIQPTLLDVNVIVADMRALLRRLIGEDVEIMLNLGREVAPVHADRGQVEQIILNLAVNARDAMPKGGRLTIETANVESAECQAKAHFAAPCGDCVALTVTDTGTGMTPEVRAHLFEPFFTTKGVGKGTGLGLATVQGVVARSGGAVIVDSELGRGTSFTVYLPHADATERIATGPPPVARPPVGRQTVLVVEDAAGLRELTKRLLERQGYTVLVAANADDAVTMFDAHPSIDLLLTDVVMPGASGPELVARLVEQRPTLKVIYMSGYTDAAIVHHGVLKPGIAFLHKPFSSDALGRKIREVLDQ